MKLRNKIQVLTAVIVLGMLSAAAFATPASVSTVGELYELCGQTLTQNLTIAPGDYDLSLGAASWVPINVPSGVTVEGSGAVISGVNYESYSSSCAGLFGQNSGTIRNIIVNVAGNYSVNCGYIGAVCGWNNSGRIENCTAIYSGKITNTSSSTDYTYTGGAVGFNLNGTVTNCIVKNANIEAKGFTGGVVGYVVNGAVSSCYVYDSAIKGGDTGGVIGFGTGSVNSEVLNVMRTSVTGTNAGGIVGTYNSSGYIKNCWLNYMDVTASSCAGGIAGIASGSVNSCYVANKKSTGLTGGTKGGLIGSGTAAVTMCKFENEKFAPGMGGDDAITDDLCIAVGAGSLIDFLGSDWYLPTGEGSYPVYKAGAVIEFSVSRPVYKTAVLSKTFARLQVNGFMDYTSIPAATKFKASDFVITGTNAAVIRLDKIYINNEEKTAADFPIDASNYIANGINITAAVTNTASEALQAIVDGYTDEVYNSYKNLYTAESVSNLKKVVDAAKTELADDNKNLHMTAAAAQEYADAIAAAELQVKQATITFDTTKCTVQAGGAAVTKTEVLIGSAATFTAVPDAGNFFVCWKDCAGNILGTNTELTYTAYNTTTIYAVCAAGTHTFTYKDQFGKVYKNQVVSNFSELAYPAAEGTSNTLRYGYKITKWENNYGNDIPASGAVDKDIVFTARLGNISSDYTVEVYYNGEAKEDPVSVKRNRIYTYEAAEEYETKEFSYWKLGDNIISYDREINVTVYSDMVLNAVYGESAAGKTVAVLQDPFRNGDKKIGFLGQIIKKSDCAEEAYHGVLLLKSDTVPVELIMGTEGVIVGKSSGYSATNSFIINKGNVNTGETWYGRAFVMYYDSESKLQIAYSDIKSFTF